MTDSRAQTAASARVTSSPGDTGHTGDTGNTGNTGAPSAPGRLEPTPGPADLSVLDVSSRLEAQALEYAALPSTETAVAYLEAIDDLLVERFLPGAQGGSQPDELRCDVLEAYWQPDGLRLPQHRADVPVAAHVTTVWRRRAIDALRRDRRRQRHEDRSLDDDRSVACSLPAATLDPAAEVAGHEDARRLVALVQTLPPKQREVLLLSAEGLRPKEIGEQLGEPGSRVRMNLKRAREAMSVKLGIPLQGG